MPTRLRASVLLACLSTVLTLGVGEGLLRLLYPTLPSMAPLASSPYHFEPFEWSDFPRNAGYQDTRARCWQAGYLKSGATRAPASPAEGLDLWVVGDSMSVGVGLPPGSSWAELVKADLSSALGRPVRLENLASPGANFCSILHILDEALAAEAPPDVVVVQLFADDLHGRDRVAVGDKLVMFPDWVEEPWLRALVERSYVANLVWYLIAPARHTLPVRFVDAETQAMFVDSLRALSRQADDQGFALLVTLFAPTGLHLCPDPPPVNSRCMWARPDMDVIADIVSRAGVDFVDLRAVWEEQPVRVLPAELKALEEGKMTMGIHPDAEGHRVLADALGPRVRARLGARGEVHGEGQAGR